MKTRGRRRGASTATRSGVGKKKKTTGHAQLLKQLTKMQRDAQKTTTKTRRRKEVKKKKWTDEEILKRYSTPGQAASFTNAATLAAELGLPYERVQEALDKSDKIVQHKRVVSKFRRRRVMALPENQHTADLKNLPSLAEFNAGYKHLLVDVDVGSRRMYVRPLKTKRTDEVADAFELIFRQVRSEGHGLPFAVQCDRGGEFDSRHMRAVAAKHGVRVFYTTDPEVKASVCERAIRTLMQMLYRYFSLNNTLSYLPVLQDVVKSYNNTRHSTTGMAPADVKKSDGGALWEKQFMRNQPVPEEPRLAEGDRVYVRRLPRAFRKGYVSKYTGEVFVVARVVRTDPPTYLLKDLRGEPVEGPFYRQELAVLDSSDLEDKLYEVEEILDRKKTKKDGVMYKVRWRNYGKEFDSWVRASDVEAI